MFDHVMESKERTIANDLRRQQRTAGVSAETAGAPARNDSTPPLSRKVSRADR